MRAWRTTARRALEIGLTIGLFGISAILSTRLFWQLAGDDKIAAGLLATVALLFEGSKVCLWIWGVKRRAAGALVLAAVLVVLSLFASFASALAVLQAASSKTSNSQVRVERVSTRYDEVKAELLALTQARDALPPDYLKARERYTAMINPLREELAALETRLNEQEAAVQELQMIQSSTTLFDSVGVFFRPGSAGKALGDLIRLVYLLVVAAVLEIAGLVMSYYDITGTNENQPASALGALEPLVENGLMHLCQDRRALCARELGPTAVPGSGRPCPTCAMKAAQLVPARLQPGRK